jgi:hypothetical protein
LSTFIHIPRASAISSPRSLKYEYEQYVEHEIEDYKDSVSRNALLKIGDEAVEALRKADQIALTELLVWQEVDRIIARRLRLPTYATWKRRRLRMLEAYRRPEHWGIDPDAALVRALAERGVAQFGVCLGLQGTVEAFGGALDVLERARVVGTLAEALDGITWAGATAMAPRDFGPPALAPRACS